MISSTSSFLSFSFRFFLLQILRFSMRDWLALPLSPSSADSSIKHNSSDEGIITTDEDEDHYDMINKTTSEEEEGEQISTWLSILTVFGVAKKPQQQQQKTKRSCSVSSATSSCSSSKPTKRQIVQQQQDDEEDDEVIKKYFNNKIVCKDEISIIGESTDDEEFSNHEDDDFEEEMEQVGLKRSLSTSSIASSTDTDNSTPASSQIMRPSSSKYFDEMALTSNTTTPVKICWNHGGKKVQVTGEFDNWSVSVDMVQDTENMNRHVVYIPMDSTKDIEFKFIVDGEWRYASDLPHRTDWRGNVNNVVYKKDSLSI